MANFETSTSDFPPLLIDDPVEPVVDIPELIPFNYLPRASEATDVKAVVEEPPLNILERDYPRIAAAIKLLWGNRELEDYFEKLIVSDREGREGFPVAAFEALLKVQRQHQSLYHFPRKEDAVSADPFNRRAYWTAQSR